MDFNAWKQAIFDDVERLGLRPTARKYGLSVSSLQNMIKGEAKTGLISWARLGLSKQLEDFKDPIRVPNPNRR